MTAANFNSIDFLNVDESTLNLMAMSMVSKDFNFEVVHHPEVADLGIPPTRAKFRVVGVAITEFSAPELLLLEEGGDHPDYVPIDRLKVI